MKILNQKFEYGNNKIQFNEENMYVDFCENVKDLTYYENVLGEGNYSTYLVECKSGGQKTGEIKCLWALVTRQDLLCQ